MKNVNRWFILALLISFVIAGNVFADGQIKLAANGSVIEEGNPIGVYIILSGSGTYDVYASLTGGLLGEAVFYFAPETYQFGNVFEVIAHRSSLDIGSLSVEEKILNILPEIELANLAGVYTFRAYLTNPGESTPLAEDTISVELE